MVVRLGQKSRLVHLLSFFHLLVEARLPIPLVVHVLVVVVHLRLDVESQSSQITIRNLNPKLQARTQPKAPKKSLKLCDL